MTKFSDLNLDPKVLQAVAEAGYETPTPIQAGAIPPALLGRDVLGIAQTGTGKTASFTLPMITLLAKGRARARMPRSLVLCPTRELAAQVAENFDTYTKYLKLTKALLIGGVSFKEQDMLIDRGVDVLIATPGRLLDHFERGKLLLTGVQIMVVDEADRMLDMGFIPDIERIFSLTPFTRQTMFYSATMAPEIERITNTFLTAPARIEVARQASASETITQGVVMFTPSRKDAEASEKRALLRALIDAEGDACSNAIIFCNRKTDVDIVAKSLQKYGYDAAPIHGDLEQSQRTRTLDGFRDGSLRFLVASDVAARGLDIPAVSHVFNFDVPSHAEDYVHRIGRTGRAGRSGKALMIWTPRDVKYFEAIEKLLQKDVPRLDLPEGLAVKIADSAEKPSPRADGERSSRSGASRSGSSRSDAARSDGSRSDGARSDGSRSGSSRSRGAGPRPPASNRPAAETASAAAPVAGRDATSVTLTDAATVSDAAAPVDRPERRDYSRDNARESGRNRDRDPQVLGLGDHLPEFIALSFEERRSA